MSKVKADNKLVAFRLNGIETLQYALLNEQLNEEELDIIGNFNFGADEKSKAIRCSFKYDFRSREAVALTLEVALDFVIEPESFDELILQGNKIVLPKIFATHLAMMTVGTARGILHEKTKGTALHAYPLPTFNVQANILSDIEFVKAED